MYGQRTKLMNSKKTEAITWSPCIFETKLIGIGPILNLKWHFLFIK